MSALSPTLTRTTSSLSPLGPANKTPQSRVVAVTPGQGRGYQFPHQKLPSGNPKSNNKSPKDRPALTRAHTTPSRTTAPLFPDEVLPNLFISDLDTAAAVLSPNYAAPGRPKIKYILSLLESATHQPKVIDMATEHNYVLKLIIVTDWTDTNLIQHLPEARDFIKTALAANDGGVLVHCRQGISRSGSVMIAYVMEALNMDFDAALSCVQKVRSKVFPNIGFQNQLKLWRELDYSLVDSEGLEKAQYTNWKKTTKLRIGIR